MVLSELELLVRRARGLGMRGYGGSGGETTRTDNKHIEHIGKHTIHVVSLRNVIHNKLGDSVGKIVCVGGSGDGNGDGYGGGWPPV